jgi:phosphatidylglycerophosphate synthase
VTDNRKLSGRTGADGRSVAVQAVTASRVVAAALFASTALTPRYIWVAVAAYAYASLSDLLDGCVARVLRRASDGGAAFDIGSDKYLSIASVLYGVASGASIVACCLAIVRSVFVPALRTVRVDGVPLLPPRRAVGLVETFPLRLTTAYMLLCAVLGVASDETIREPLYWVTGLTSVGSLIYSVARDWSRIVQAFAPCD